jgi:NCAIR mutase (PurE)-related protein
MKKIIATLFVLTVLISCKEPVIIDHNNQFKTGVFEIPAGKGYSKTIITRIDSLQIEEYTRTISISTDSTVQERKEKHIDTLYIKWKNNFSYILRMKSPKTSLDKDKIFVLINKVTDSSYSFTAKIGFSKYKQKGTVYKVKN